VGASVVLAIGVWDLGLRADAATLTMAECLRDDEGCEGERIAIPHHPVDAVEGDIVVLAGRGYRVELVGVPPELRSDSILAYVSAIGTWRRGARVEVSRVLLHRFGRVKMAVGAASLLSVAVALLVFLRRRLSG